MAREFAAEARPHVEALLEPGEQLQGIAAATQQGMFTGHLCALATTDRRLILLPLDRHIAPKDEPVSLTAGDVASASVVGFGNEWWSAAIPIATGFTLRLKDVDGTKYKLNLMGGGSGMMGALGGGPAQEAGVQALAAWFSRAA
jgi:hypothetical protein